MLIRRRDGRNGRFAAAVTVSNDARASRPMRQDPADGRGLVVLCTIQFEAANSIPFTATQTAPTEQGTGGCKSHGERRRQRHHPGLIARVLGRRGEGCGHGRAEPAAGTSGRGPTRIERCRASKTRASGSRQHRYRGAHGVASEAGGHIREIGDVHDRLTHVDERTDGGERLEGSRWPCGHRDDRRVICHHPTKDRSMRGSRTNDSNH